MEDQLKGLKKSWKYHFATPSIRHALSNKARNPLWGTDDYEGLLPENLIASILFNLSNRQFTYFKIYYSSNKKRNVDFLIQKDSENIISIEGRVVERKINYRLNRLLTDIVVIMA